MNEKLLKPYSPVETEDRIYRAWEAGNFFAPGSNGATPESEKFSMVLPPPNVTGELHLGHAAMLTIEDIMTRYARMRGLYTLWLPGTDHAAIATQAKVEKMIEKAEGKRRHDLGREALLARIEEFADQSRDTIVAQTKKMGASLDWSREAFTLDEKRSLAVKTAFIRMYEAGLIYRGYRVINWDPKGQTTISDDEIVYEERPAKLYTFKYSADFPIAIATTRPETKVGDVAVAVHPDDARYQSFIGQTFKVADFCGVALEIKVIASRTVDPAFGTGALGVTPAHSQSDWALAEAEKLPHLQVIDERARMMEAAGPKLAGKKALEARELVANWLRDQNLLEKEEEIKQNISLAERTGGIIEPLPKRQWFVAVDKPFTQNGRQITLKQMMLETVTSGKIKILPERFVKVYENWIANLHDWCISRQIWYGHRIPAWFRGEEIQVGPEAPTGLGWEQDPDTLDTWFSSGLWTFSTLGWPEQTADLKIFHPTTILETGYDILFFWVARMILMTGFLLGDIPFKTVYLHGLVRDAQNRKLSKSLGNAIDPLDMIAKYGADAVRLSLIVGTAPGNDSKIWEDKIKAYKHFANKIWNASRFVLEHKPESQTQLELSAVDKSYLTELDSLVREVTEDMNSYRYYLAAEKLYHYFWHTFADKIIEEVKARRDPSGFQTLYLILTTSLRLLHPFMPFLTEELWSLLGETKPLIISPWPTKFS